MKFDVPQYSLEEHAFHLKQVLRDGCWHKSKTIMMESRMLRLLAEKMPDVFLSDQRGYKLVEFASTEEITSSINQLESKAKNIQRHADALKSLLEKRNESDGRRIRHSRTSGKE